MRKYLSLLTMLIALAIIPACGPLCCRKDAKCGDPCPCGQEEVVMETAYVDDLYAEDMYMAENDDDETGDVVPPQKI